MDPTVTRADVPRWAAVCLTVLDAFVTQARGRRWIKFAWAVNLHKIVTVFLIFGMMVAYGNFSIGAWTYLALHGVYGYCWLIKDFGFRDHQLETRISLPGAIGLYVGLIGLYWLIPYLFLSRHLEPTGPELAVAIAVHTIGVVVMIAADGQRHWALRYREGLITDGMFRYTRNPNYLGEILLYGAYAWLASHWLAWAVVAYAAILVFIPRMYRKDYSLSRHPGWARYRMESGLLIPWGLLNGRALRDLYHQAPVHAVDQRPDVRS